MRTPRRSSLVARRSTLFPFSLLAPTLTNNYKITPCSSKLHWRCCWHWSLQGRCFRLVEAFQKMKDSLQEPTFFQGYALRDIIYQKWGACFDIDFSRVAQWAMGFTNLYLNILPFRLGKWPFRHASEYDYLCHLQAIVEILKDYITSKSIRLDLTPEKVKSILGWTICSPLAWKMITA